MIYGFDTDNKSAATAALLVYAIWRSRDWKRFKITPDVWGQIERFTKDAAKRATRLTQFIEALKPRLACASIRPQWMAIGWKGEIPTLIAHDEKGRIQHMIKWEPEDEHREFLTQVFETADHRASLKCAYEETAWIVLLVRDRLEREKPLENRIEEMEAING